MELHGLTGKMRFDNVTGNRNYFKLDVVKVHESKKHRMGSWDPELKMTLTRSASEIYSELSQSITNKTFIVVGKLVKHDGDNPSSKTKISVIEKNVNRSNRI